MPTEAVIQTGTRTVVMLAEDNGAFRPGRCRDRHRKRRPDRDQAGPAGRPAVVVSSQFLIDSEASLKRNRSATERVPKAGRGHAAPRRTAKPKSRASMPDAIMLSHGPIPSLKWPEMTMEFKLGAAGQGESDCAR